MMRHTTHTRAERFRGRAARLLIGCLCLTILGTLSTGADADAIKSRFSFNSHWIFKQFKKDRTPTLVTRIEEGWTGAVPPWHREVMAALPIPAAGGPDAERDGPDAGTHDPFAGTGSDRETGAAPSTGVGIHDALEAPITSRSGQEEDDVAVTDNAFGHSGQEFFERPSERADG